MRRGTLLTLVATLSVLAVAWMASAADTTPPKIVNAEMKDEDGNGNADRVKVTWSEPVTFLCDKPKRMDSWVVDGYKHTGVTPVEKKKVMKILFEEKGRKDGDAAPKVIYNGAGCKAKDAAGNVAKRQEYDDTKPFAPDTEDTIDIIVTGQFAGNQPGTRLECASATVKIDTLPMVGKITHPTKKTCKASFENVPIGKTARISITGTWLPLTPVGGCRNVKIEEDMAPVTLNLRASDFARCILP